MKKIKWLAVLASLLCGAVFAETTTPDGETAEGDGSTYTSTATLGIIETTTATTTSDKSRSWSVSQQPSNATVTLTSTGETKKPVVTIVAKSAGTSKATIQGKNDSGTVKDTWTLTVTVLAPNQTLDVDLCVDDTVLFGQRQGTQYRWKNMSANTAVATVSQTSYTDNNVNNCDAMIEAIAVGKTAVMAGWYTRSGSGGNYTYTLMGYTLYNVTVGAAREVKIGATTDVVCKSPVTGMAWSKTDDANGRATVALSTTTSSAEETTATITGAKEGGATVTVSDYNNGSSAKTGATYTLKLTVSDPREKHNEAVSVAVDETTSVTATSAGAFPWGISSAATTIATVDPATVEATESATFEVAGVKVGDTTVVATNAAAIWNYAVTVYDTSRDTILVTNETSHTETFTSEVAAPWTAVSDTPGVATVVLSSAESTKSVTATVTGVAPGDAVVTVSNKYQITTLTVRVFEMKEGEKVIPLSGGSTVECESPVEGEWSALYDEEVIKSVDLKSLDPVKLFASSVIQNGPVAKKVAVTVEPREGLDDGKETEVLVSNGYTLYTLKLTITKTTETETLCLANGTAQTNALSGVKADYKVNSADPAIATAEIVELADKTNLVITALKVGNTKVTVDGPEKTIIYKVVVTQVTIEKTVLPWNNAKSEHYKADDLSNATIRVATHVEYKKDVYTNKILYVGSTCTSHTLTEAKVLEALNNLKDKGNVQWALFGVNQSQSSSPSRTGTLTMGQKDITSTGADFGGSRHRNLKSYLSYLDTNIDADHKNFDYIVLSFDGSRLAIDYSNDNTTLNASVAGKLRWYYENKRILWITDSPASDDPAAQQFDAKEYYHPVSLNDDGSNWNMPTATWEAMVALLDPATYLDKPTGSRYNSYFNSRGTHSGTRTYEVRRIDEQASYEKSEDVAKLLDENIKPVRYDAEVLDKVQTSVGDLLKIPNGASSVRFYQWMNASDPSEPWADEKKDDTHWKLVTPNPVKLEANNQVSVMVSNVAENAYMMLEVDIRMEEGFLDAAKKKGPPLCTWDEESQSWKIDPNEGPAELILTRIVEGEAVQVCAKGKAVTETKERWPVPAEPIVIVATDYFDVYDGEAHTIDFAVNPDENPSTHEETQVRFSTDNSNWTVWTNYSDRAEIWPTWTDCCWSNKVYIEARSVPGYTDTNAFAYVTITQRVVRIQANDATKTYDGKPLTNNTFTVLSGFVDGEGFADNKTTMSASSTRTDAGTADNEITKVGGSYQLNYKSNTKASNYTIETEKGTLTVNRRPIQATAQPAEKVYDGNPTGIVVTVSNVIDADKAKIQKNFTPENSFVDVVGDEAATTVECTVEVDDNYTPITVSATVKIKRRPLTVTADNKGPITEGDPLPELTAQVAGLIGSDTLQAGSLKVKDYTGSAGTYYIVEDVPYSAGNNYKVTFNRGKLTVKAAPKPHTPCAPAAEEDVARVFQMQLNVYTTEGRAVGGIGGSQCAPGGCIVIRGKGKAMLRGYVFVCGSACELTDYLDVFCDAYHAGAFFNNVLKAEDPTDVEPCLKWSLVHAIGKNMTDAETAWAFKGTVNYDPKSESPRTATYELTGAGYGQFNGEMFNDFSGCFAGTVSQTFDHVSPKTSANSDCLCAPSQIVTCDSNGMWITDEEGSVAFGKWKMKYNASASKAYAAGRWNPITAITKAMSH